MPGQKRIDIRITRIVEHVHHEGRGIRRHRALWKEWILLWGRGRLLWWRGRWERFLTLVPTRIGKEVHGRTVQQPKRLSVGWDYRPAPCPHQEHQHHATGARREPFVTMRTLLRHPPAAEATRGALFVQPIRRRERQECAHTHPRNHQNGQELFIVHRDLLTHASSQSRP